MNLLASEDWINFLTSIGNAKKQLKHPENIWLRGHGNVSNYLLPTLLRYENGLELEQLLFYKFRRVGDKIFKNKKSEWETLFDMQHYGVPTRLLDWTENLGIALFFAVTSNKTNRANSDAAIYLLDPIELNKKSKAPDVIRIPYDENEYSYSRKYWHKKPTKAIAPIAIEPNFINDRMLAQRGMFTVHHDEIEPIEDKFSDAIIKVILPYDALASAEEFLLIANINEFSIFPDLLGVSNFIIKSSGLKYRYPKK